MAARGGWGAETSPLRGLPPRPLLLGEVAELAAAEQIEDAWPAMVVWGGLAPPGAAAVVVAVVVVTSTHRAGLAFDVDGWHLAGRFEREPGEPVDVETVVFDGEYD